MKTRSKTTDCFLRQRGWIAGRQPSIASSRDVKPTELDAQPQFCRYSPVFWGYAIGQSDKNNGFSRRSISTV